MAKKEIVTVDEEMMRGIMMKEVPVFGSQEFPNPEKTEKQEARSSGNTVEVASQETKKTYAKKKKKEEPDSYEAIFLINDYTKDRVSVNISRKLFSRIRTFLPVIGPGITLTSYLNNIISEHLETNIDEIDKLYNSNFQKNL